MSMKLEDFSPIDMKTGQLNPAFPLALAIAPQVGLQLPPEAVQNAMDMAQTIMAQMKAAMLMQPVVPGQPQTEHPGATTPMQPISKHVADRTAAGGVNLVN
jgi:glycerol uptake facilitator-like aquaporin